MGIELITLIVLFKMCIGSFTMTGNSMTPTIAPNDKFVANMIIYKFEKPLRGDVVVFKESIEDRLLYTQRIIGLPGERIKVEENGGITINGELVMNQKIKKIYTRKGYMADQEWRVPKNGDTLEIIGGHAILENNTILNIDMVNFKQLMKKNDKDFADAVMYMRFLLNGKDEIGPILDLKYNKDIAEKLINGEKVTLDKDYYFVLGDNSNNSYDSRYWGFVAEDRIKGKVIQIIDSKERIGIVE